MIREKTRTNYQMTVLLAIAICFIILGHVRNDLLEFGTFYGWFPYYSFHLPVFLFVSGYFFHADFSGNIFKSFALFFWKKFKNYIIPMYVVNGIFLVFQTFIARFGFTFGKIFSFKTWLVDPWTEFEPYTLARPSWYLMALFVSMIFYFVLRLISEKLIRKGLVREILLLVILFAAGIFIVIAKNNYSWPDVAFVYLRSVVMLFFIHLGFFYRHYLEEKDKLPNLWYFIIVFALQFALILTLKNDPMNTGLYGIVGFGNTGLGFFIGGITGTALYLRISRIIAQIPARSRLIEFIGANTKYIMCFHLLGFFALNTIFYFLFTHGRGSTFLGEFNIPVYFSYVYYHCGDHPRMTLMYLVAGMAVSLLISWLIGIFKNMICRIRRKETNG